jgi:hypothetical protein
MSNRVKIKHHHHYFLSFEGILLSGVLILIKQIFDKFTIIVIILVWDYILLDSIAAIINPDHYFLYLENICTK